MTVISYQSKLVLRILKAGETYRAKPNLTLRGEYNAMIDLLGLHCECPIFGVARGKSRTPGGSFRLGAAGAGCAGPIHPFDRVRGVGGFSLRL